MTRQSSVMPSAPTARPHTDDSGVSLAEVIVAMFILSGIVAALAGLLIQSLSSLKTDQSYQVATQLVNVRIEETRALTATALNAGIPATQISTALSNGSETQITGSGPYRFGGETVITTNITPTQTTSLNPYRTTTTVDNVTYTLTTYLTRCWQPKASPGTCNATQGPGTGVNADAPMARVTVVASWDPPGDRPIQSTSQQTLIYPGTVAGA